MLELDHEESWARKNSCFWIVVPKKTFESPLECKEIKLVNPEGNQPLIFIERTDAEAPGLWPPDMKCRLIEKDLDAGKDSRQKEKGATENEVVGWYHRLTGHEFEQTPGDGEGQGSLACCSPWGRKESDTALQLNNDSQARNPASQDCRDQTCVPVNVVGQSMSFGAHTKLVQILTLLLISWVWLWVSYFTSQSLYFHLHNGGNCSTSSVEWNNTNCVLRTAPVTCGAGGLVAKSYLTLAIPWTVACQAPLSMGFSRQEYWSGLPFPSPGDLPHRGIKPESPAIQADDLPTELWGKPKASGYP